MKIVTELMAILSTIGIDRVINDSGAERTTVYKWKTKNRKPRLDLFIAVADSAGYDVVLLKREAKKTNVVKRFFELVKINEDLALDANVSTSNLYNWRNGQTPKLDTFERVIDAAGYELVLVCKVK